MIRNIVFDMGQVMIRFDPNRFLDRAGITDARWGRMPGSGLPTKSAEPLILARIPDRLKEAVRELLYNWAFPREQIPGMEDLVKRLKEAGYGIWLLSNASRMQPLYWAEVPVSRYFDGTMISCDVRVVKPCREIYRAFTEKFSLKPEECLFIDDSPANVAGAIACGWQGIVFHGDEKELEQKIKDILHISAERNTAL